MIFAAAWAGTPVVYDGGEGQQRVDEVAALTGLPADQLDPVSLDELLRLPPKALGAGGLRHCSGAPTRLAEVQAAQVRAELAWREGDATAALDQLDLGIAALGCLVEIVDPAVAARLFLLRGGLYARAGDAERARAELVSAVALAPGTTWDASLPAEGALAHAEVAASTSLHLVDLVPSGTTSGPWLDGRAAPGVGVAVLPGLHLLQYTASPGVRSAWLWVEGATTVVFPVAYRRPVLQGMRAPSGWPPVEALLRGTLPGFFAAYVVSEGGVWLVGDGVPTTVVRPADPIPPAVEEIVGKKRKKKSD